MKNDASKSVLNVKNLRKFYGTDEVLHGIDLEVERGEVVVVLGPSGCGKSTFLRCLNGLEEIQQGEIQLNGRTINTDATKWHLVRQKIGMVFQSYDLFPHMTILENILLGPLKAQKRSRSEAKAQAEKLLDRVGLLGKKDAYPSQLSGGQKQRVAIVRALCMNPEIMLFDEVTASLDPEMVREVLDVMQELAKQGMTMVIVTHEMGFARSVADRIVFVDGGKIIESSAPEEFFTNPQTDRARKFLNIFEFSAGKEFVQKKAVI